MKLFIASDIHGSYEYAKKLIECFEIEKADKLVILGDILYHGPRNDLPKGYEPKKVIELLNNYSDKIMCVKGNCDTEVDQMVLTFPILSPYIAIYDGDVSMYFTHGHTFNEEKPMGNINGAYLICGHTHVAKREVKDTFTYLNPGSVSIPKENTHQGYIVYEDKEFIFKDLDGNIVNM